MKKPIFIFIIFMCYSTFVVSQRGKLQRSGTNSNSSNPFGSVTSKPDTSKKNQNVDKKKACDCNRDLEYDRDKDIAYSKLKKDLLPFTGTCIVMYPSSNQLEIKATYIDGKEHGTTYKFYKSGTLNVEMSHNMGIPDGEWKFFSEDSVLRWSKNYINGELDGEQKWFFPSGNLKKLETFSIGAKNGKSVEYYKDSSLKKEVYYRDNELHGSYKKFANDSNSTLLIERNYHKGQLNGHCNFYYESGAVGYNKYYKKGKPDGTWVYFFENGNEKATEVYRNGKKEGVWKSYHENKKMQSEIIYKKDKEISKREWDRFGREL